LILIASAAYVDQDLSAEVGLIPPSFLPIGNKRLYEHQIAMFLDEEDDIYLSLPASFVLDESDLARINELGANVLFVPDNISLGESILYSWNATGKSYANLKILHGDTLFLDSEIVANDFVSISVNNGAYQRAAVEYDGAFNLTQLEQRWVNDSCYVLSGLFGFKSPQFLMKCIIESKNDFVSSLVKYILNYPLNCRQLDKWLDFGHLNSFFSSRTTMTTQRVFNDLKITKRSVIKKSQDILKMQAESHWFECLPGSLHIYLPALLQPYREQDNNASYAIEYLYLLPLSDLFVFGNHSMVTWKQIFSSANEILNEFKLARGSINETVDASSFEQLYLTKTLQRLDEYRVQSDLEIEELLFIVKQSSEYISAATDAFCSIVHGDFCFSNLLYDSRTQSLKLIDPRGFDANKNLTVLGDRRYDLAKLFHSAIGCYDLIIAGRYFIKDDAIEFYDRDRLERVERAFDEVFCKEGSLISKHELIAINVHLFLSMLPLHHDRPERQLAMVLNAKRLFNKLNSMGSL
jgi:hypothetical protein